MKESTLPTIILALLVSLPTYSFGADYTGFWKTNCSDGHGVQIQHINDKMYSVSFCGPGGCFSPGSWTPNTTIDGDKKYNILSKDKLVIGDFTYNKCTSNPTWEIEQETTTTQMEQLPDCSAKPPSIAEGVLIAWVTDVRVTTQHVFGQGSTTTQVDPFRPIAVIDEGKIQETMGGYIHAGQLFWHVLSPDSNPEELASVNSFLDYMNEPHCVYFGTLKDKNIPQWTLLSSKPLHGLFRKPSAKDENKLLELNNTCLEQGDYLPNEQPPPCVRPKLLAVSDINQNGSLEYWATEPYKWDTGLTVWEEGKNKPILEVCVGCSD
jgi:hypothetical protein